MLYSLVVVGALFATSALAQPKPTFLPGNLPETSEPGQSGTNRCLVDSPTAKCQNLHINSLEDFCLYAPPEPHSTIGETEPIVVAYCTHPGHGTRIIPAGTLTSAHFITTPSYIQITGYGDFTRINVQAGDAGGELDAHGASGLGNPVGSLLFAPTLSNASIPEWSSFMSATQYYIRVCVPAPQDRLWCNQVQPHLRRARMWIQSTGIVRSRIRSMPRRRHFRNAWSKRLLSTRRGSSASASCCGRNLKLSYHFCHLTHWIIILAVPTTPSRLAPTLSPSRTTILTASATQSARSAVASSRARKNSNVVVAVAAVAFLLPVVVMVV